MSNLKRSMSTLRPISEAPSSLTTSGSLPIRRRLNSLERSLKNNRKWFSSRESLLNEDYRLYIEINVKTYHLKSNELIKKAYWCANFSLSRYILYYLWEIWLVLLSWIFLIEQLNMISHKYFSQFTHQLFWMICILVILVICHHQISHQFVVMRHVIWTYEL